MKPKTTEAEAVYILGLPEWYTQFTPADFWTREAFNLFQSAKQAGIITFEGEITDSWTAGPNIPKAGLAYFCKRACRLLHLNKGAHTNWKPFELMFNPGGLYWADDPAAPWEHHPAAPLRLCLHDLEESEGYENLKERIDSFFDSYAATTEQETTKTK